MPEFLRAALFATTSYCFGNPVGMVDPDGLNPDDHDEMRVIGVYRGLKRELFTTVNRGGDAAEVGINLAAGFNPGMAGGLAINSLGKGDYGGAALAVVPGAGKGLARAAKGSKTGCNGRQRFLAWVGVCLGADRKHQYKSTTSRQKCHQGSTT